MGYRLEIYNKNEEYICCGGKLFGYYIKQKDLECYKWMLNKKYIDEDTIFDYGSDIEFILERKEFEEFISLYLIEYIKFGFGCYDTALELINKILLNKELNQIIVTWE